MSAENFDALFKFETESTTVGIIVGALVAAGIGTYFLMRRNTEPPVIPTGRYPRFTGTEPDGTRVKRGHNQGQEHGTVRGGKFIPD